MHVELLISFNTFFIAFLHDGIPTIRQADINKKINF